ncbi:N-acetylglucosamine kinase [Agromyces sp. NPDC056379]|uniref:N-acetylglucosamine kinase n=1 Tax=unclassified Agromyces TaxID=2639701 RepID=UPI0035DDDBD6
MTTVAAVDGGKSGLRIRISTPSGELAGDGPGFVYTESSHDLRAIVRGVRIARDDALGPVLGPATPIDSMAIGLTGVPGDRAERAALITALEKELATRVLLVDDALLAHAGAVAGPGTVLSAGTGSIVLAIAADGRPKSVDGWGPILGDRGSAYAIGLAGMRAASAAVDGAGPITALSTDLADALGGTSLAALQRFYRSESTVVAVSSFALRVAAASEAGDGVATEILRAAAADLADTVSAAHAPGYPISHTGRLLEANGALREFLSSALAARGLRLDSPRGDALTGGLRLARATTDPDTDMSVYAQALSAWESEGPC